MNEPQLWVLVGGNGSGKSTFFDKYLKTLGMPFVNADQIAKDQFPDDPEGHSYDAAGLATDIRMSLLDEGNTFCFETVFSHSSKVDFIGHAKALGYSIVLVFIHLDDPQLNKARVSQRVAGGGHNVPDEKIESRIPRLLKNVAMAIPLCDQVRILDNSDVRNPFQQLAVIRDNVTQTLIDPVPVWLQELLGQIET